MIRILLWICLFPIFASAQAQDHFQGFVQIGVDRELYVDWKKAQAGQPTVVLLNGLTYSTKDWERFAEALTQKGVGVLRYDPLGMGQTLLKYAPVTTVIPIESQVLDLRRLLQVLKLEKKVNLVGLSYGGGLSLLYATTYPEDVGQIIAMAPYTEPLAAQDQWIQSQIWYTRQVQPWNKASDDELYAYFFRQIVYTTYPTVEPSILENPFKLEAVTHLGLGIRKFRAGEHAKALPKHSLHLLIAGADQYIAREVLDRYWEQVPDEARASRIVIANSEHKIPEALPKFSAALVREIVKNPSFFSGGQSIEADPYSGEVIKKDEKLKLPKEY